MPRPAGHRTRTPPFCDQPSVKWHGPLVTEPEGARSVDGAVARLQGAGGVAGVDGDDLGADGDGGLLRGAGADVEANGGHEALQLLVGDPLLPQAGDALLVGAAGAHRPEI